MLPFPSSPQQDEEPIDLEISIEVMIQSQNNFNKCNNRVEVEMSQFFNLTNDKNEKAQPNQLLTIPDISKAIDLTQESWYSESFNQDSVSSQPLELDQYQSFENHINNLTSYHFSEIKLEHECDPEPQFSNSVPILNQF